MGFAPMITFTPAIRKNVHFLIGIAGASGSGKTYTALQIATGLAGENGRIAAIDTESGRMLHYADRFKFDHCDLTAPFSPDHYLEAIRAAEAAHYDVIIVDSFSHEHAGIGGLLEMAEAELQKPNIKSPANWALPKSKHKKLMDALLQVRAHIVLALRAEERIRIEKVLDERTGRERTVVVPAGWIAVTEKTVLFEMVVSFVMSPERPGVPIEGSGKIQDQHRFAFPPGKLVTQEAGRLLAEWAAGGAPPDAADTETDEQPFEATRYAAEQAASMGTEAFRALWKELPPAARLSLKPELAEYQRIAEKADRVAAMSHTDDDPFNEQPSPDDLAERATNGADPGGPDAASPPVLTERADGTPNWTAWAAEMIGFMRDANAELLPALRKGVSEHAIDCPPSVMKDIDAAYDARRKELRA